MDTKDRLSRIAPLAGLAFVVLQLASIGVAAAGGSKMVALGDGQAKILKSFTSHVGAGVWIGAYMTLASVVAFSVFAIWSLRAQRGPLRTGGLLAVGIYGAITVAAVAAGGAMSYGIAHGLGDQSLLVLFYLQSGFYFATWGIAAAFILLVPATGWLRRSAVVIAGLLLLALAFPTAGPSQFPDMLFLFWVLAAGFKLSPRAAHEPARAAIAAT